MVDFIDFMSVKYENPQLKQSEIGNQLGCSSSTIQRYRIDMNMLSPWRIQSNNTIFDNNSHREPDVQRPQMTSNDLKTTQTNTKSDQKNKNILKAGSIHENIGINDQYLDGFLDNNDI